MRFLYGQTVNYLKTEKLQFQSCANLLCLSSLKGWVRGSALSTSRYLVPTPQMSYIHPFVVWVWRLEMALSPTGRISRTPLQNTFCEILCHLSGPCHSSSSCWTSSKSSSLGLHSILGKPLASPAPWLPPPCSLDGSLLIFFHVSLLTQLSLQDFLG